MAELPCHVAEFPFQKLQYVYVRRKWFIISEKDNDILILNVVIKNLCNLSNEKSQLFHSELQGC